MINTDRIVPVQATDLVTLYGTIMKLAGTSVTPVQATNPVGSASPFFFFLGDSRPGPPSACPAVGSPARRLQPDHS